MGMARFFFHIRDGGRLIVDEEGLELADLAAAKFEAEASALDLIWDAVGSGENITHQVIEVADGAGAAVMQVALRDMLERARQLPRG